MPRRGLVQGRRDLRLLALRDSQELGAPNVSRMSGSATSAAACAHLNHFRAWAAVTWTYGTRAGLEG